VQSRMLSVHTGSTPAVVDLTRDAADFVSGQGSGLLNVFVPHATAGVAVLELGSGSDDDLLAVLDVRESPGSRGYHDDPGHN